LRVLVKRPLAKQRDVRISIPASDKRSVSSASAELIDDQISEGWRHLTLRFAD
jgi:alpha-glucosidase